MLAESSFTALIEISAIGPRPCNEIQKYANCIVPLLTQGFPKTYISFFGLSRPPEGWQKRKTQEAKGHTYPKYSRSEKY